VIPVDDATHRLLLEMSQQAGESLADTTRAAAETLWRERFFRGLARDLERLQSNPVEWEDYLAEAESTHVTDGID
jgi:hypothetical protein